MESLVGMGASPMRLAQVQHNSVIVRNGNARMPLGSGTPQ